MDNCEKASTCGNRIRPAAKKALVELGIHSALNLILFICGIMLGVSFHSAAQTHKMEVLEADRDHWRQSYAELHLQAQSIQDHFDKINEEHNLVLIRIEAAIKGQKK